MDVPLNDHPEFINASDGFGVVCPLHDTKAFSTLNGGGMLRAAGLRVSLHRVRRDTGRCGLLGWKQSGERNQPTLGQFR